MNEAIKNPVLMNADAMTVYRPSDNIIRQLNMFDFAKLCVPIPGHVGLPIMPSVKPGIERFWVEVIFAEYPIFTGRVHGDLFSGVLVHDELIRFHADNVWDVLDCSDADILPAP